MNAFKLETTVEGASSRAAHGCIAPVQITPSVETGTLRGGRSPETIAADRLHFRSGNVSEANGLILQYHYSKRVPANVQFVGTFHFAGGLFGDYGEAVAAVCFSIPPARWSETVWELSRLVRADACKVPLTRLISLACKEVLKNGQDLLLSFADAQQGHHGGVYQASGWNYDGQRDARMDGLTINGAFVPGRTCNSIYGTQSPDKLRAQKPNWTVEPHYDVGKHLYWRALNKSGEAKAKRLELKRTSYPKPSASERAAGVALKPLPTEKQYNQEVSSA